MPQARMFTDDQIVGFVDLPDMTSTQCRIVRVSGDSMSPVIRNGDYIAVRELTNLREKKGNGKGEGDVRRETRDERAHGRDKRGPSR